MSQTQVRYVKLSPIKQNKVRVSLATITSPPRIQTLLTTTFTPANTSKNFFITKRQPKWRNSMVLKSLFNESVKQSRCTSQQTIKPKFYCTAKYLARDANVQTYDSDNNINDYNKIIEALLE